MEFGWRSLRVCLEQLAQEVAVAETAMPVLGKKAEDRSAFRPAAPLPDVDQVEELTRILWDAGDTEGPVLRPSLNAGYGGRN